MLFLAAFTNLISKVDNYTLTSAVYISQTFQSQIVICIYSNNDKVFCKTNHINEH